jgi:ribosomal-protein-alanine N-acetyltransferase
MQTRSTPRRVETDRLVLAPPAAVDAEAIFLRYASDPEVTRYLSWPTHRTIVDTAAFIAYSDAQWTGAGVGAYLIRARDDGTLLGSTGLTIDEAGEDVQTGYVLARDAWGRGYATEALHAMVAVARGLGLPRLVALCHVDHRPSRRVLEKCAFTCDPSWTARMEFPNLAPGVPQATLRYVRLLR